MALPFVGGSYNLEFRKADVQRSVNLYPSIVESGAGKAPAVLQSIPGYTLFSDLVNVRGIHIASANGRVFVVAGSNLCELNTLGATTILGALASSEGPVSIESGLFQLVVVDGPSGYVLTFVTGAFQQIGSPSFYGSNRVAFLDGYFLFIRPDTQQFYISAIDDATDLDALDFASAEAKPDKLTSLIVDHRDLMLFGSSSTEGWENTGAADFPFERNRNAVMEVGCVAPFSAQKLDSTFIWVGSDENGQGQVWMADGYKPTRISTVAVEEAIQSSIDLSAAVAYTYQQFGHSFYCLNAPGLETTWVFDVNTRQWHERAELVNGEYQPIRGNCHAYAFDKHLIGAEGGIYFLDRTAYTIDGDVLVRDRISPHDATPNLSLKTFAKFTLDCIVGAGKPDGTAPSVQFRYSNDGGNTWQSWRTASLGAIGAYATRVVFRRLGIGRDRVWQIRCTENTPFSIVNGGAE